MSAAGPATTSDGDDDPPGGRAAGSAKPPFGSGAPAASALGVPVITTFAAPPGGIGSRRQPTTPATTEHVPVGLVAVVPVSDAGGSSVNVVSLLGDVPSFVIVAVHCAGPPPDGSRVISSSVASCASATTRTVAVAVLSAGNWSGAGPLT